MTGDQQWRAPELWMSAAAAHWGWCVFAYLICNMPPSNSISYLYVCHSSHLLKIVVVCVSPEWILLCFCVRGEVGGGRGGGYV